MPVDGHRQLSLFSFPLLDTRANGFTFKGKRYAWKDVDRVEVWQGGWPPFSMVMAEYVPRARIALRDGMTIRINGRAFEKRNAPLDKGYSSAFDEIIDRFEPQTRHNNQCDTSESGARTPSARRR
jgi:hypothetical protein